VADTIGGLTAAFAIASALVRRGQTGAGDFIDVSMLEAILATMGWQVSNCLIGGIVPKPMGNENMTASPSGTYATRNGLLNIAANKQEQFETLARLIGRPDLADDPRFKDREDRLAHRYQLKGEIEQALQAKSAKDWAALFNAEGVPAGEVLSVPEILAHPQIAGRNFISRFEQSPGVDRPVAVVRSGFRLASGDPKANFPPPLLGADTQSILGEIGYSDAEIEALQRAKAI
jgi:crotonobetainyl-CoA:carnitine CoA-transferase CaiB-like acyl-CoA transferase